jgi:hypothetical protein
VLKNIPQWADVREEIKKTSSLMKRKISLSDYNNINSDDVQVLDIVDIAFDVPPSSK